MSVLDYSKSPPGYILGPSAGGFGWWTDEPRSAADYAVGLATLVSARVAAWSHYKAHNDPPGLDVNAWGFGQRKAGWWRPLSDEHALATVRAAAWVWYDSLNFAAKAWCDGDECVTRVDDDSDLIDEDPPADIALERAELRAAHAAQSEVRTSDALKAAWLSERGLRDQRDHLRHALEVVVEMLVDGDIDGALERGQEALHG